MINTSWIAIGRNDVTRHAGRGIVTPITFERRSSPSCSHRFCARPTATFPEYPSFYRPLNPIFSESSSFYRPLKPFCSWIFVVLYSVETVLFVNFRRFILRSNRYFVPEFSSFYPLFKLLFFQTFVVLFPVEHVSFLDLRRFIPRSNRFFLNLRRFILRWNRRFLESSFYPRL